MRQLCLIVCFCLLMPFVAFGQPALSTRDYAVVNATVEMSPDNRTFTLAFMVRNTGATAQQGAQIRVINLLDNSVVSLDPLAPIASGGSVTVRIPLETSAYPTGVLPLEIQVGVDENEPTPLIDNNTVRVSVTIPDLGTPPSTGITPPQTFTPSQPNALENAIQQAANALVGRALTAEELLFMGVVVIVVIIVLWLFSLILRLVFRRDPTFSNWHPPYAIMPFLDGNSLEGRRQAWQQHAQNNLILAPNTPNNYHAVKQLVGIQNDNLGNWRIIGVRLSQYDNYGRVSRSQVIAPTSAVKRLNAHLKRRAKLTPERFSAHTQAISRQLVAPFRRKITKNTAFLPIALDIRLTGKHGEVRIFFELYQSQGGAWHRIDQWEPSLAIPSHTIDENFTFTIHGQGNGEKLRDFQNRLAEDVGWLLVEMLRLRPPVAQPNTPQYDVPDTLTGVKPIQ